METRVPSQLSMFTAYISCASQVVFGGDKGTKPAQYVHCLYFLCLSGSLWWRQGYQASSVCSLPIFLVPLKYSLWWRQGYQASSVCSLPIFLVPLKYEVVTFAMINYGPKFECE